MPLRSLVLSFLLAGVSGLCWQVSGSEREVGCVRDAGRAGPVTCTEVESGPLVAGGRRVAVHPLISSGAVRVAQLRGAGRSSTLWSLVVVATERPTGDPEAMERDDVSLVIASGFTRGWAEAQRARFRALEGGPAGASVVFRDGWRGGLSRWGLRLVVLSFVLVGVWDLRARARASGARAPLVWAAGVVGALLGSVLVALLLA